MGVCIVLPSISGTPINTCVYCCMHASAGFTHIGGREVRSTQDYFFSPILYGFLSLVMKFS